MTVYRSILLFIFISLFAFWGCARYEVRHLASDASLIVPGATTSQDVVNMIGPPDQKITAEGQGETWRYYQTNKSMLRKTPYIGEKLGHEEYDVLTVSLQNNVVRSCVYRHLSQNEFEQLGIDTVEE